jgi:hypothetical protein
MTAAAFLQSAAKHIYPMWLTDFLDIVTVNNNIVTPADGNGIIDNIKDNNITRPTATTTDGENNTVIDGDNPPENESCDNIIPVTAITPIA